MTRDTIISTRSFSISETEFRTKRNGNVIKIIPFEQLDKITLAKDVLVKHKPRTIIFGLLLLLSAVLLINFIDVNLGSTTSSTIRAYGASFMVLSMLLAVGIYAIYQALCKRMTIKIEFADKTYEIFSLNHVLDTHQYSKLKDFLTDKFADKLEVVER